MSHNEGFIGMPPTIRPIVRPFVAWLLLAVTGCASIGPATVPRDRVDYITAVAEFLERAELQRKGMACRVVNYQTTVPGPRAQRSATITWCKTNDGWKVA